jgi:putative intracellular protease/amidase/YHS domain-containing protein
MNRRTFLQTTTSFAGALLIAPSEAFTQSGQTPEIADLKRMTPPKDRALKVAFLISEPFQVIDFAGPWEVFGQVFDPVRKMPAFDLFTVSRKKATIKATGGLKVVPDYTFANAPTPDIVVVPAQGDESEQVLAWLRKVNKHTQITMSVCTGAFLLAKAGLLDGLEATTFHDAYKLMAMNHPKVKLKKQVRYIDNGHVSTSSGLSAGIDLALHIVARYFGHSMADEVAATMEYVGYGWKNPTDTGDLFDRIKALRKEPICPVCDMGPVGKEISYVYKGKTYYFCSEGCKKQFVKSPDKFRAQN